jgi:hypothetical protein
VTLPTVRQFTERHTAADLRPLSLETLSKSFHAPSQARIAPGALAASLSDGPRSATDNGHEPSNGCASQSA